METMREENGLQSRLLLRVPVRERLNRGGASEMEGWSHSVCE